MGLENPLHIALIAIVVLMVFGAKRLPELGRSVGRGMREFKESVSGEDRPHELDTPSDEARPHPSHVESSTPAPDPARVSGPSAEAPLASEEGPSPAPPGPAVPPAPQ